jgi:hypothetical protein
MPLLLEAPSLGDDMTRGKVVGGSRPAKNPAATLLNVEIDDWAPGMPETSREVAVRVRDHGRIRLGDRVRIVGNLCSWNPKGTKGGAIQAPVLPEPKPEP